MSSRIVCFLSLLCFIVSIYSYHVTSQRYEYSRLLNTAIPDEHIQRVALLRQLQSANLAETQMMAADLALLMAQKKDLLPSEQESLVCEAVSSLKRADVLEQGSGFTKSKLAYLLALLKDSPCAHAKISPTALIREALILAPHDHRVLIFSARVHDLVGDKANARKSIRRFLLTRAAPTPLDRAFVYHLMDEQGALEGILPASADIVSYWIKQLARDRSDILIRYQSSLVSLIESSLSDESQTPKSFEYESLFDLFLMPELTTVRPVLARSLKAYSERNENKIAAQFFLDASREVPAPILPAYIDYDSSPHKNALRNWAANRIVRLDVKKRTVGFFLLPGQPISAIYFYGSTGARRGQISESLRILTSENNQLWNNLQQDVETEETEIMGKHVVVVRFPQNSSRYWKVHYRGALSTESFYSPLKMFIQASGGANVH